MRSEVLRALSLHLAESSEAHSLLFSFLATV